MQIIGSVLAVIGAVASILVIFTGGATAVHLMLPIGLLVAIAGYLKQIAAATAASYALAKQNFEAAEKPMNT